MSASRRNFLMTVCALPLAALGGRTESSVSIPPPARSLLLNCFSIAGFQYYGGPALLHRCVPLAGTPKLYCGCPLNLVAEPDNQHDRFAVAIYLGETKLGYVPRSDNKHISRLLDQEARLECKIIEVNRDAAVWNMVRVEVTLEGFFQAPVMA